jgi:TPR repeat protein
MNICQNRGIMMKKQFKLAHIGCFLMLGLVGCSKPSGTTSEAMINKSPSMSYASAVHEIIADTSIKSSLSVPRYFECDPEFDQKEEMINQLDTLSNLPNNEAKREEWINLIDQYVKLADLGSCEAFYKLGEIYYYDFDFKQQDIESNVKFMHSANARPYFEVGAVLGNPDSELHLGLIFEERACDKSTVKGHLQCLRKLTRQKNYFQRAYEGSKDDETFDLYSNSIASIQYTKQSLKNIGEQLFDEYVENNTAPETAKDYIAVYESLLDAEPETDAEKYGLLKQAEYVLTDYIIPLQAMNDHQILEMDEDSHFYTQSQPIIADRVEDLFQKLVRSALNPQAAYPMTATCDLITHVSPQIIAERKRLEQDMSSLIVHLQSNPGTLLNQDFKFRRNALVKGFKALANQDNCYAFYNLSLIQQFLGDAKSTPTNVQKDPRFAFAFARVAAQAGLADASWLMSRHAHYMLHPTMSSEDKTHTLERAIRWADRADKQMDPKNVVAKAQLLAWKEYLKNELKQIPVSSLH